MPSLIYNCYVVFSSFSSKCTFRFREFTRRNDICVGGGRGGWIFRTGLLHNVRVATFYFEHFFFTMRSAFRLVSYSNHISNSLRTPRTVIRAAMSSAGAILSVGARIPASVSLQIAEWSDEKSNYCGVPKKVQSGEVFKGQRVVLFGVPGAFTPTVMILFAAIFLTFCSIVSCPACQRLHRQVWAVL